MSVQSWTPRRAAALSRRHLKAARAALEKHLTAISVQWAEEDGYMEQLADRELQSMLAQLDDIAEQLAHSVSRFDDIGAVHG